MNRLVVSLSFKLGPCGRSHQLALSCQTYASTTEYYRRVASSSQRYDPTFKINPRVVLSCQGYDPIFKINRRVASSCQGYDSTFKINRRVASSCQRYDPTFKINRRVWGSSSSFLKLRNTSCVLGYSRGLHGDAQTKRPQLATDKVPTSVKDFSEMPGPKPWPVLGNVTHIVFRKDYDVTRLHDLWASLFEEYGPIIKLKFPGMKTMVVMKNPDDVETSFKTTMDVPTRDVFISLKTIRDNAPNDYFKKKAGLIAENGKEWHRLRTRVQGTLLKPRSVASYLPQVDKTTKTYMERIDFLQAETGRVPPDFLKDLYLWAIECLGYILMDRELGSLEPGLSPDSVPMQLVRHLTDLFAAMNDLEVGLKIWKLYKTKSYVKMETAHNAFLEIAVRTIEEASERLAQAKDDPTRTLSMMETLLNTEGLSKSDVATVVMDLFFAGMDTSAHSLAFMLYLLAKNPEAQKKLQEEVDTVLGDATDLLPEHINDMTYLSYVVKESLRLYPVAIGTARDLQKDVVMSGYNVPAGTLALGATMLICHEENYFHRAKEFLPERWARDRPYGPIHPFASLPFAYGTRMCIGKRIAEQEMYTFLIRAMQKYSITFESSREMKVKTLPFVQPDIPLAFKFHRREYHRTPRHVLVRRVTSHSGADESLSL